MRIPNVGHPVSRQTAQAAPSSDSDHQVTGITTSLRTAEGRIVMRIGAQTLINLGASDSASSFAVLTANFPMLAQIAIHKAERHRTPSVDIGPADIEGYDGQDPDR